MHAASDRGKNKQSDRHEDTDQDSLDTSKKKEILKNAYQFGLGIECGIQKGAGL